MNCKNCGHIVDGNFCSHCGQSSKVSRINFPNFIAEVSEGIFQVNKGFFYTLKELFTRPGNSIKEFLDGKRKNHFKPIAYVLTLSTLYFLITQIIDQNTWIDDLISGWLLGATGEDTGPQVPKILLWLAKNYGYSTLLLLPVFSLASYLSFRKFGKNYLEHIVIKSYVAGQQAIFYTLFAILGTLIKSDLMQVIPLLIAVSYTCWVFWQLFSGENLVITILRSLITYILYLLFSLVLLFAIMGIGQLIK